MSKKTLGALGFHETINDNEVLRYTKSIEGKGETHITFYHEHKLYVITLAPYQKHNLIGVPHDVHQAITEQLKELGWSYEDED